MASSFPLLISVPSLSIALIPLNSGGLWEAVITTPPATLPVFTAYCSVGVGRMPQSSTLQPVAIRPDEHADLIISFDVRASVPIMTGPFMKVPIAMPSLIANNGSISFEFTTPLTPFVPNNLGDFSFSAIRPLMFESQIKACCRFAEDPLFTGHLKSISNTTIQPAGRIHKSL